MHNLHFKRDVMEEIYKQLPKNVANDMAIPSYLHGNPLISWIINKRMNVVVKSLNMNNKPAIMDYGCGVGMLFMKLPPGNGTYYGIDRVPWPGKKFLESHEREDVMVMDGKEWFDKISDGYLDYIIALEVLEHVDDLIDLVRRFRKKLKPDGKIIICGPTENIFFRLGRKIANISKFDFSGEYHCRDIYQIMKDIEAEGFIRESDTKIPLPEPFTLFIASCYKLRSSI